MNDDKLKEAKLILEIATESIQTSEQFKHLKKFGEMDTFELIEFLIVLREFNNKMKPFLAIHQPGPTSPNVVDITKKH